MRVKASVFRQVPAVRRPAQVKWLEWLEGILIILLLVVAGDITRRFVMLEATDITFYPLNGSFQTYNPLRRILAGELPGRDFQTYLGLGTTYTMYGMFRLFGSDLAASEAATHLLHAFALAFSGYLLARLAGFKPLASSLALLAALVAGRYSIGFTWFLFYPGNSMLGWRAVLIYFTAVALLHAARLSKPWQRAGVLGVIAGLQHLWSNDYGTASLLALTLGGVLWFLPVRSFWQLLGRYALYVSTAAVTFTTVANLLTGGHAWAWLIYNWRDVRHDQFWYFGESNVYALSDIFVSTNWALLFAALALLAIALIVIGWKRSDVRAYVLAYLLGTGLIAWAVSTVGGSVSVRYASPTLWASLGAVAYVLRLLGGKVARAKPLQHLHTKTRPLGRYAIILIAATLPLAYAALLNSNNSNNSVRLVEAGGDMSRHMFVPELGGYIVAPYSEAAVLGRAIAQELPDISGDARVFSTYTTALDVAAGANNAAGHDYIIHALGQERRRYLEVLQDNQPAYITTLRESFTWWETWNRRINWWFYRAFLPQYEPVALSMYNVVWARRPEPLPAPHWQLPCQIDQVTPSQTLLRIGSTDAPFVELTPYYVEVDFAYQATIDATGVPLIGDRAVLNIRERPSAAQGKQPRSKAPVIFGGLQRERTAIEHFPGLPSTLRLQLEPAERTTLEVSACRATVYAPAHAQVDGTTIDPNLMMPTWSSTFAAGAWGDMNNQPWLELITATIPSEVRRVPDAASPEALVSAIPEAFIPRFERHPLRADLENALRLSDLPPVADMPPLTRYSATTRRRHDYDLSALALDARDIDGIFVQVRCRFINRQVDLVGGPMVRLSWQGENTLARDAMLHFRADTGSVFVPLPQAAWRNSGVLEQLSLELVYAQNCSEFFAGELRFYRARPALLKIADLNVPNRPRQDLAQLAPGYYRVTGNDPGVVYDVSSFALNAADIHVLAMTVSCENPQPGMPLLFDVFWRDGQSRFSGESFIRQQAHQQRMYFNLAEHANWQGDVRALRVDLASANACERVRISELALFQRFETANNTRMYPLMNP